VIYRISLNDCLEPYAPPAKVLNIGALDDTVFVSICEVNQDGSRKEIHKELADISVSLASLLEAVALLATDQEREHLRPVENAEQGTKETRLAGSRLAVVPTGPASAVGALTTHLRYALPRNIKQAEEEKP
jgi:hypothetical protein